MDRHGSPPSSTLASCGAGVRRRLSRRRTDIRDARWCGRFRAVAIRLAIHGLAGERRSVRPAHPLRERSPPQSNGRGSTARGHWRCRGSVRSGARGEHTCADNGLDTPACARSVPGALAITDGDPGVLRGACRERNTVPNAKRPVMRCLSFRRIVAHWMGIAMTVPILGAQTLGAFDSQADVGSTRHPGTTSYDSQRQQYVIAGSGQNMWNDRDDFHFVWKRMTGNFILSTRAHFIGKGVEAHRKIGWTIRPSLDANSPHVTAALHGDGLASLQFRRAAGAMTEENKSADSLPDADAVIQLERRDGVYLMSVARFGDTLATQQLTGVRLPDTVYVGLFVCAHNDTVVERGTFSNVRITTPAKSDFVPYRDYIGSNLEILDVTTGNRTIVHRYRGSFQAPNWTLDGKALIYAQEGRLYRFDLASRTTTVINTGFATRNNNDHVLSFDGRMLAISNHAPEDSGASIVYTVPTAGGTHTRITAKG